MVDDGKHWVEDVFPPTFAFSLADFREKWNFAPPSSTEFKHWVRDRQERPFREAKSTRKESEEDAIVDETLESTVEIQKDDVGEDEESRQIEDENICHWTWEELNVLRNDRDFGKSRILELELKSEDLEREVKSCKEKIREMKDLIVHQTEVMGKLKRENEEMHIRLKRWRKQCGVLDVENGEMKLEKMKKEEELRRSQDAVHRLEMEKIDWNQRHRDQKEEIELMKRKRKNDLDEVRLAMERDHIKIMESMKRKIDTLKEKLDTSIASHKRDAKALEHLRRHYSRENKK